MSGSTASVGATSAVGGFAHSYRSGEVEVIVMNRPEKLNAWTEAMRSELAELFRRARGDDGVGAVVLTGTGRGFCAGQDFAEASRFDVADQARTEEWLDRIKDFYDLIRGMDKPTVAAINGVAAGSGFQVALLMDVRVAHTTARLGQPEVNSGIPSITGTYLISTALGPARTAELVLSGRLMTAHEARAAGAVHEVTDGDVVKMAVERARRLAAQPRDAIARTKSWLRAMGESGYQAAFAFARAQHREAFGSGGPQNMMSEFLESRSARRSQETRRP